VLLIQILTSSIIGYFGLNRVYAETGSILLIGDIDGNGEVNSSDFAYMRMVLVGKKTGFPVEDHIWASDVNGDGQFNSIDLASMRMYLLGKIDELPKQKMLATPTATPTVTVTATPSKTVTPTPTNTIKPTPTPQEIDEKSWGFKIKVEKDEVYQFPIRFSSRIYCIVVNWGDGTTSEIIDYSTSKHKYESAGTYTIEVSSFLYMPLELLLHLTLQIAFTGVLI